MNESLDPQLVTLAKAIRQTESQGNFQAQGKSGEYGAYQFMPSTWAGASQKYLGQPVPLAQASPQQQNEVAYKQLAEWKQQHPDWNIGNFASAWNAGPGKPNAYQGNSGTNSYGVKYDTPAYAQQVANAYHSFKSQSMDQSALPSEATTAPAPEGPPSLGGFAHNVLTSGAGLLAGVGEAVLHPIQTIQNIGGAAVGGLQEAAGQQTENTAKFDNIVSFFKDRYGSLDSFEKTLYHDPVGVAADLSTLLGGAGLAAKVGGIGAKAAGLGDLAEAANTASKTAFRASDVTNPLTPFAVGAGKAANVGIDMGATGLGKFAKFEPATIEEIRANPAAFTPDHIATMTREVLGGEVENAIAGKLKSLSDTGKEYAPLREVNQPGNSFSSEHLISVEHNFMENQLRKIAGVEVKDGRIISTANSSISTAEASRLQGVFDRFKPAFQKGALTPNEFLNFRHELGQVAYNDIGKKSTDLARITDQMRHNLNESYRADIPGLKELDLKFETEKGDFEKLRKGLFDRNGKPNDTMLNLVANATNKGNVERLARLEQLLPGITAKIKVLKAIEDIRASMGNKVGTYGTSIAEAGGVIGGLATGHLGVAAASIAAMIISEPTRAVQLIRVAEQLDPAIVPMVLTRLGRYATISAEASRSIQTGDQTGKTGTQSQDPSLPSDPTSPSLNPEGPQQPQDPGLGQEYSLDNLAKVNNFDLAGAREAGYTDEEIQQFLSKS